MYFARWENMDNMKKIIPLYSVDGKSEIKASGLPICYDENNLYIDGRSRHSLIIGSTGSGKTQAITLPMLKLACLSYETVIVHDTSSEVYKETKNMFLENGYKVINLNFDNLNESDSFNPFELAHLLYKDGNADKAQDLIEDLGYYLLNDLEFDNSDPFWINSAVNYFTGLTLYMIEKKDEVNLDILLELDSYVQNNSKEFIKELDKKSNIYVNLKGILESPEDTRGSIFSVFSQRIKKYISRDNLKKVLSNSSFDITNIFKEKTIIYLVSGNANSSEHLIPLFLNQVYYSKDIYSKNDGRVSIIIDNFYDLYPIKNFPKLLDYSRSIGIMFTVMVRGFNDLKNKYGKEETELLKLCFSNIMYLLSQDMDTIKEISKYCGNQSIVDNNLIPLISVEELKTLDMFEAVILITRIMPIKTKLLPYYEINK